MFEITRTLRQLLRSIQQLVDAKDQQRCAAQHQPETPLEIKGGIAVSVPPTIGDYYASENRDSPGKIKRDKARLVIECVGLIAVIVGGIFAYRTFREVQRQAKAAEGQLEIMQRQFESADRAWIKVDVASDKKNGFLVAPDGRAQFSAKITLTNIGRSVASHVYIRQTVFGIGLSDSLERPIAEQKKLCAGPNPFIKPETTPKIDPRYTIFPNDEQIEGESLGFDASQIKGPPPGMFEKPLKNGNPIQPFIVGCVDYEYPSSRLTHQTGFIYEIFGGRGHQGIQTLMAISAENLTFEPWAFGGKYAN